MEARCGSSLVAHLLLAERVISAWPQMTLLYRRFYAISATVRNLLKLMDIDRAKTQQNHKYFSVNGPCGRSAGSEFALSPLDLCTCRG